MLAQSKGNTTLWVDRQAGDTAWVKRSLAGDGADFYASVTGA